MDDLLDTNCLCQPTTIHSPHLAPLYLQRDHPEPAQGSASLRGSGPGAPEGFQDPGPDGQPRRGPCLRALLPVWAGWKSAPGGGHTQHGRTNAAREDTHSTGGPTQHRRTHAAREDTRSTGGPTQHGRTDAAREDPRSLKSSLMRELFGQADAAEPKADRRAHAKEPPATSSDLDRTSAYVLGDTVPHIRDGFIIFD